MGKLNFAIVLLVFIDLTPPATCDRETWVYYCKGALVRWYAQTGVELQYTRDVNKADLIICTSRLPKGYGATFKPSNYHFPALPCDTLDGVRICIDTHCPFSAIYPSLLHEVGHSIGLHHRPDSIMHPRGADDLQPIDRLSIKQLRVEVLNRQKKSRFPQKGG